MLTNLDILAAIYSWTESDKIRFCRTAHRLGLSGEELAKQEIEKLDRPEVVEWTQRLASAA